MELKNEESNDVELDVSGKALTFVSMNRSSRERNEGSLIDRQATPITMRLSYRRWRLRFPEALVSERMGEKRAAIFLILFVIILRVFEWIQK